MFPPGWGARLIESLHGAAIINVAPITSQEILASTTHKRSRPITNPARLTPVTFRLLSPEAHAYFPVLKMRPLRATPLQEPPHPQTCPQHKAFIHRVLFAPLISPIFLEKGKGI